MLYLTPGSQCITTASSVLGMYTEESLSGAQVRTGTIFYFWVIGQSCLENFDLTNIELASQPTPTLVCLALYLFYINKYIEIGTIYDSGTFTYMVLYASTVSYGILKSHYLQWNPPFSLSCHLFSWSKWNLDLGRLQKQPRPGTEPQAGVCYWLVQVAAVDCTSD